MKTHLRQRFPSTPVLLLSLFIAAMGLSCGGGGGSAPPPPTDQDAQGLYTTNGSGSGTFKNADPTKPDVVEPLKDIKGMVYGALPNQKFIFFDVGTNVLYEGNIQSIKLTGFTGTATVYHDGVVVEDGVTAGTAAKVTVHGSIISRSNIDMTLDPSGNFKGGSIKGLFSTTYDKAATNARIFADGKVPNLSWGGIGYTTMSTIAKVLIESFDVKSDNSYSLNTTLQKGVFPNCIQSSKTPIQYTLKNIFVLNEFIDSISDAGCSLSRTPDYIGFASVVDDSTKGVDRGMWFAVANGTNSIFGILTH